jgi:hypothetical protein
MSENLKKTALHLKERRQAQIDELYVVIEQFKLRKGKTEDTAEQAQHDIKIANANKLIEDLTKEIDEYTQIAG